MHGHDEFLSRELNKISAHIPDLDKQNLSVSKAPVAWHLDHSLKVINSIVKALKNSDPQRYRWRPNISWTYILLRGSIPRGVGKSPKRVMPQGTITEDRLRSALEEVRHQLGSIENLHPNSHFSHPYFGMLNLTNSRKFLKIHTRHHLSIIEDIVPQS